MARFKWLPPLMILAFTLPIIAQDGGITDPTASIPVPTMSKPAVGVTYNDPAFGTSIRRVTGASDGGGFGTHVYSQLQAFSPDNQYILVIEDGAYLVRRLSDLSQMPVDTSIMNDARWHPAQPHTLIFYDGNGDDTVRVQTQDVETTTVNTVYTFPAEYVRVRVPQSYEELSHDGRWMAAMLTRQDDTTDFVTVDLQNDQLGAVLSLENLYATDCTPDPTWGNVEPDWIGVSPLGNYLIVQWVRDGFERCNGMEAYYIGTGQFAGHVYEGHQHGDLGVDTDGSEFFMTLTLSSPMDANRPAVATFTLPGDTNAPPQPDHLLVVDWADSFHISCQGPAGYCLVSYGGWEDDGWTPFEQELFLMYTDASVLRLAHHRSTACGYWVQPRATLSRDGSYTAFASDWGDGCQSADGNGDTYVMTLDPQETPPTDSSRIYPADGQALTGTVAGEWPRFTFNHMDGVEWYRLWIGPDDYRRTDYDQWLPAFDNSTAAPAGSGICDVGSGVCTVPVDLWLADGSYAWWMTHWGPSLMNYSSYWNESTFRIDFPAPNPTVTFTNPADGTSVSGLNTIEWQHDPAVLWYHLWVGPADYTTQMVFEWINATEACNATTCSLDVSNLTFADGNYEIWTEVWSPHAYLGWLDVNGGNPITFSVP